VFIITISIIIWCVLLTRESEYLLQRDHLQLETHLNLKASWVKVEK